jgi:aerobic carbon-monoxide dehydrogenase large subunit
MTTQLFGTRILRREDDRLLRGTGRFLDDIVVPEMLYVAFHRSPHAHARIRAIDTTAARAVPGVVGVVVAEDLGAAGAAFPQLLPHQGLASATWRALACGKTRFVGEAVAVVVAESQSAADDGVEALVAEYEPLPAVLDLERAVEPGSPLVHDEVAGNLAVVLSQQYGDVEAGLRDAPHRLAERFRVVRAAGQPLEARGVVATADRNTRELTVWSSTQEPHTVRDTIAGLLGMPASSVRVIAPDTGGGFGTKLNVYPEEVLVPWLAQRFGRPVKWTERRGEHMLSATHEREQIHEIEVGFDGDGTLIALKDSFLHDMGAYAPRGGAVAINTSSALPGSYRIGSYRCAVRSVYTNKATVAPYRGAGQPQAVFVMERVMDRIAQYLGIDPAEIRRRNTICAESFPYDTRLKSLIGTPVKYDSGDFEATLKMALDKSGYAALRERQAEARKAGRLIGIGIASYVELTGRGPWEGGGVRVEPDGTVTIFTGAPSQGQGHATTLAQICADELGVPFDRVRVAAGDTSVIAHGIGTFASRVGVLAGNAVKASAVEVRRKILQIAEDMLEAAAVDLRIEDGLVSVEGVPGMSVGLAEVARVAAKRVYPGEKAPGLEATTYFTAPQMTYANGTHVAAVEVDPDTGAVSIIKYVVAHDCGRMINPMVVEGQIQGGVACGIGNALLEEHVYDATGQLLTGSFMDYAMPRADDVPAIDMVHQESPSPLNPLGVKGAGEAGTIPVAAAICAAVEDALTPLGIRLNEAPLTLQRVFDALQRAKAPSREAAE